MSNVFCVKVSPDVAASGRLLVFGNLPYISESGDLIIGDKSGDPTVPAPLIVQKCKWIACYRVSTQEHSLLYVNELQSGDNPQV